MINLLQDLSHENGSNAQGSSRSTITDLVDDAVVAEGATDEISHFEVFQRGNGSADRFESRDLGARLSDTEGANCGRGRLREAFNRTTLCNVDQRRYFLLSRT
jgi:hypothetical protein